MTVAVNKALRRCTEKAAGERDLHDCPLDTLKGFEFNSQSPLAKAFLAEPIVSRGERGEVILDLPAIHAKTDLVTPFDTVNRYQIRFLLAAVNLRAGFCEFTGEADMDVAASGSTQAQRIVFDSEVPKGCMLMLGMTVVALENLTKGGDYILNNKEFNPAAILAVYQSEETIAEPNFDQLYKRLPTERKEKLNRANYCGNSILKELERRLKQADPSTRSTTIPQPEPPPEEPYRTPQLKGLRIKI